jgi:hypothetical protein
LRWRPPAVLLTGATAGATGHRLGESRRCRRPESKPICERIASHGPYPEHLRDAVVLTEFVAQPRFLTR